MWWRAFLCCSNPLYILNIFACLIHKFLLEFPTSVDLSFSFYICQILCKYFEVILELDYPLGLLSYLSVNLISPHEKLGIRLWLQDCIINSRHTALETCLRTISMADTWQYTGDKYVLFDGRTMSNSFLCPYCPAFSLEHRVVNKWLLEVAEFFLKI